MWRTPTRTRARLLRTAGSVPGLALASVMLTSAAVADPANVAVPLEPVPVRAPVDDEDPELGWSRTGGYVGIGGTFALEHFEIQGEQHDSGSLVFRGGYRGYSWLSVELLGEVLPRFEGRRSPDNDVSGFEVTVNAKLVLPLGRVEPWTMVGIGVLDIDEDQRNRREDFAFRGAAGADLHLTPHWALYGEAAWLLPTGAVDRYDYATFGGGLLYRF